MAWQKEAKWQRTAVELDNPYWLADLEEVDVLRSNKPRSEQDVTIVTLVSLDRLKPLQMQCLAWPGSVAAVLYIPLVNGTVYNKDSEAVTASLGDAKDLTTVMQHLRALHANLQTGSGAAAGGRCVLDLAVYSEELPETSEWFAYPVNALRNRALALARTEVVMLLDGDFVPGPVAFADELHANAAAYDSLTDTLRAQRTLVVLPALETNSLASLKDQHAQLQEAVFHSSKAQVADMVRNGLLQHFQRDFHRETNIRKWLRATAPYEVEYDSEDGVRPGTYEPYVLARREDLPVYEERYRGYHMNKMSYFYLCFRMGFRFLVHPDAYVIHTAHPDSVQNQTQSTPFGAKKMQLYYTTMPYGIDNGYLPIVAHRSACRGAKDKAAADKKQGHTDMGNHQVRGSNKVEVVTTYTAQEHRKNIVDRSRMGDLR